MTAYCIRPPRPGSPGRPRLQLVLAGGSLLLGSWLNGRSPLVRVLLPPPPLPAIFIGLLAGAQLNSKALLLGRRGSRISRGGGSRAPGFRHYTISLSSTSFPCLSAVSVQARSSRPSRQTGVVTSGELALLGLATGRPEPLHVIAKAPG